MGLIASIKGCLPANVILMAVSEHAQPGPISRVVFA
jgi:hypothetical protein